MLTLSSIETNVNFKNVNLTEVVSQALTDLEEKIKESNAQVTVAELPHIRGNHEYLVQLFYNLIGNGIKFSKGGAVIEIRAEEKDGKVFVDVKDNGIGMKEEETKRIFTAFERLHARNEFEGSGIGLAICKKIIDAHGGEILVRSQPGVGTVFTVALPA